MEKSTNTTGYEADLSNKDKNLQFATGQAAASGVNTLIAAPGAGKQIKIVALQIQNESATATVGTLKFGTVAKWRTKLLADAIYQAPIPVNEEWSVGANLALVYDLAAANAHSYSVVYYVE